MKTVHGSDFYANKKHKGDGTDPNSRDDKDTKKPGDDGSGGVKKVEECLTVTQVHGSGERRHSQVYYLHVYVHYTYICVQLW